MVKKYSKNIFLLLVSIFALIGLFLTAGYVAIRYGFTNTEGIIDTQRTHFFESRSSVPDDHTLACALLILKKKSVDDYKTYVDLYRKTGDISILKQQIGVSVGTITGSTAIPSCDPKETLTTVLNEPITTRKETSFIWARDEEWLALESAIRKDEDLINTIARQTGVSSRILITPLVVEQLRLFHSEREIFKKFFSPLKILGSQTQFSWGIYGLKEETAKLIENNLASTTSPFYIGEAYTHMLDFPKTATSTTEARFTRITGKDRTYGYLYTALYLKQLMHQWESAGFPINNRPEILGTLFNIGFKKSMPKENPSSGGALITINGVDYSFGELAYQFYYSPYLIDIFPPEK